MFNGRLDKAKEHISELEDKATEFSQIEQQREKGIKRSEYILKVVEANIKQNNIHIIGILEEESDKGTKNLSEKIRGANFLIWAREWTEKPAKFQIR